MPAEFSPQAASKIAVIGNVNADLTCGVPRMPLPGETLLADSLMLGPGGKASNASVAIARLGATPRLISGVGDDALGTMVLGALEQAGVSTADMARRGGATTGVAIVLVGPPGSENTIVTQLGANLRMESDEIPALDDCAGLVMTLGLPRDVLLSAIQAARTAGIPVIVDATPLREVPLDRSLTAVDLLTANRVEVELLTGRQLAEPSQACADLHALGAERVVIKLGGEGAFWSDGSSSDHVSAPAVHAVDPTGAGDAFTAALAVRWLAGEALEAAVRFACAVGALATTGHGAQGGWSTLTDVKRLLAEDPA